jgi:hypothetical protein
VVFVFAVGMASWFIGATQHGRAARNPGITTPVTTRSVVVQPQREQRVLCQAIPGGQGYLYSEPIDSVPHCDNGATPVIVSHN